jgi:small subunit ribosomal protein S17
MAPKKKIEDETPEAVEAEDVTVVEETPPAEEAAVEETVVEETAPEPVAEEEPVVEEVVEEPVAEEPVAEELAAEEPAAEEPVADEPVAEEAAAEPEAEVADEPAEEPAAEAAPEEPVVEVPVVEPKRKRKRLPRALRHKHSKPTPEKPKSRKAIVRTPRLESEPGRRQERRGVVVSDKGDKTIVVKVAVTKLHPKYQKVVRRTSKFHAHDEENTAAIGDVVRIVETRPLSKTKNWRLAEIVEKAK